MAGLAAGTAHRDAILGASLIGGTSYAIGNLTLDRRRVLAFDAGIRALDCANAAVIPLDLGEERLKDIVDRNKELEAKRKQAALAAQGLQQARRSLQAAGLAAPDEPRIARLQMEIDTALEAAKTTHRAAAQLTRDAQEVGQRLESTVHAISARVDGFIAQTVPDLSVVPQAIAGLGGFAAAFAPGAGIDKVLAESYAAAADKALLSAQGEDQGDAKAAAGQQLVTTVRVAADALNKLADAHAEVLALLADVDGAAVVAALKACNVDDVVAPLTLQPAALQVEAAGGPGKGFTITGGKKPYMVRWVDAPADGLSLTFSGGFSDVAQISATQAVASGIYRLQVDDAAGKSAQLGVSVNAKPNK